MDDGSRDLEDEAEETIDEDEDDAPLDLRDVDPEAWHAGIPWRPSLSLLIALLALPVVSILVRGMVADRLAVEAPDQLWLLDAWNGIIAAAVIAGAILVSIVPVAARFARGHDGRIFWLLEHGFRVGVALVTVLVLLHTIIAVGLALAIERLVLGIAFPATTGMVGLAGLASATYLATTGLGALRTETSDEPALVLDHEAAPGLFAMVGDLAGRMDVDPPPHVLLGPTMEFWVGSGAVRTFDGTVDGLALHASIPQMALLSRENVEAILAHELAHIRHGDVQVGARMRPMFDRVSRSIETLKVESRGLGRIAARPALLWLEFARDGLGTVIGERRRASEAAADARAAEIVGADAVAEGLIDNEAIASIEPGWAMEFDKVMDAGEGDPVAAFITGARDVFDGVTAEDVLLESLEGIGLTHPALLTRIRAVGRPDASFRLSDRPALADLVADPSAEVDRLMAALRAHDVRAERLELNPPRVTPGAVGWLIAGVVLGVIVTYRWVTASGPIGDLALIVGVLGGLWLLFPIVYPWLQREAIIDRDGIRLRPWWWRWLDPDADRLTWTSVRWTDQVSMTVGMEAILTLSNGRESIRWWGGLWPKGERDRLYDTLRDRGANVTFTSAFGDTDPERHAVIWYVADRFLIPEVKRLEDGQLIEARPAKSLGLGILKFSFALIDRLQDPVEAVEPRDIGADVEYLASLVGLDRETFERDAQRIAIAGTREAWTIRIDGGDNDGGEWTVDRSVDKGDLDDVVFDILGLEKSLRAPRPKPITAAEDGPESEGAP